MATTATERQETIRKAKNGIPLSDTKPSAEKQALYDSYNPARGGSMGPISAITAPGNVSASSSVVPAAPAQRARLMGAKELADLYGITFDEQVILNKFNKATQDEYGLLEKEYGITENKFYDNLNATQTTALDAIRKSNAAAVATGASRGMQAANELSAILGLQQEGVEGATELAVNRNLLQDKKAAELSDNIVQAMDTSNKLKQALATVGSNVYAADTQFDVGEMDMVARLDAAVKNLQGVLAQAGAQKYTADQNLAGVVHTADQNLAGNKYVANTNYAGSMYVADKNLEGTKYAANQNLKGQQALAAAQKAGSITLQESYDIQNDKYLLSEFNKAYASGNYERLVQLKVMVNPGMAREKAEKIIQSDKTFMKNAGLEDAIKKQGQVSKIQKQTPKIAAPVSGITTILSGAQDLYNKFNGVK